MWVQTAWQLHTVQTKWPKIFSAFFILFQVLKWENERIWNNHVQRKPQNPNKYQQVIEYNTETSELHTSLCTASSNSSEASSSPT